MAFDLSDEAIEKKAEEIRAKAGIEYVYNVDMDGTLQRLKKRSDSFKVRVANTGELGNEEAFMDCENHTMILSHTTFDELKKYGMRAKFTAAHELGHYVLGHEGNTKRTADKKIYSSTKQKIQEIQADKFASFFLVPTKLARSCKSAAEIQEKFQVSSPVAEIAFERIQAEIRKQNGEPRRPPAIVIEFLKEAKRRGHPIRSDIPDDW